MTTQIDLRNYGCKEQTAEFYLDFQSKYNSMDILDKTRILLCMVNELFTDDPKLHPLIIGYLMKNLQDIEVRSAKMKHMLGEIKVDGITCNKCGNKVPDMTMKMYCEGINRDCPHDSVEVEIDDQRTL